MENNDLISIIVPIYSEDEYIEKGIRSLINQTYKNIEIILVDDGSPDKCPEICDFFQKQDNRIKVIHKTNAGLVNARKTGLAAAQGQYIGYMDGDDWVEPEMYETLYNIMKSSNADIVASGYQEELLDHTEILTNHIKPGEYSKEDLINQVYPKMLCNGKFSQFGIFTFLWNKLFRREILFENQMKVNNRIFIGEDAACVYPCMLDADKVYVIEDCLYHYRQRPNSMVKTKERYTYEYECINILFKYLKECFLASKYSNLLLPQLDAYILNLLTVRSDIFLDNEDAFDTFFPFTAVTENSTVVLVGAGTFGQHLYRRLKSSTKYKLACWVDQNYKQYQKLNINAEALDNLNVTAFDYAIIAYIDEDIASNCRQYLIAMGIPENKIACVNYEVSMSSEFLNKFSIY